MDRIVERKWGRTENIGEDGKDVEKLREMKDDEKDWKG